MKVKLWFDTPVEGFLKSKVIGPPFVTFNIIDCANIIVLVEPMFASSGVSSKARKMNFFMLKLLLSRIDSMCTYNEAFRTYSAHQVQ